MIMAGIRSRRPGAPGGRGVTLLVAVALALLVAFRARAGEMPAMDTVLYGASYYHEYMPYERLDQDVELMKRAGVTVVRLGESTWSSWEPREGEFEFAWMDRVIDRLHQAGIKVLFGTPTYSIPPWLYRKHPEILVTRLGGRKAGYGPRQNMDITHPTYRLYAERIIRTLVGRYKSHPAVIGFQIDNETSSYGTAGPNVQKAFVEHLEKRYGRVAKLNEVWGLTYWGQLLRDWDEFPARDDAVNPGYKLEWERFQHQIATDYLAWHASIVRELKRPDQFVTHNFDGGLRTDRDEHAIAQHLDITGVNPYHVVQDDLDGWMIAVSGDLCRSLKRQSYLIVETMAQTTGFGSSAYQYPPYDGQLRLNAYSHLASGANMVAYWHWHSLHYGNETFWKGVLSHDLEENRIYREMAKVGAELRKIGPKLVDLKPKNRVALLYSVDAYHALEFMPFNEGGSGGTNVPSWQFPPREYREPVTGTDYMTLVRQLHETLYRLNVGVDLVFPQSTSFEEYDVLLVPALYVASDELLGRLVDFVRRGGHLLLTFKSGFADEHSRIRWSRAPGPLREAAGFSYQEFSTLKDPLPLAGDPFRAGDENRVSVWADMLLPEGATILARYDHHFFGQFPAITRNAFGKGTLTYEGTVLSDALQQKVLLDILGRAGLTGPDQDLPPSVRLRQGVGREGKRLRYYSNYSRAPQSFAYPHAPGTDLLTGKTIQKGQRVSLGPWDLIIIEEG
jgi:beta-galactosidase